MAKWAIELKFYNKEQEVEKTYSRSFVPFRVLKSAVKLQELMALKDDLSAFDENAVNNLADFVVDFYGHEFTRDELWDKTEVSEVMTVIFEIAARVQGSGAPDPTIPA